VKILIRATNWVGDAIMSLPALRAVRSRFPEAEITILARSYVAFIYKNQKVCDKTVFLDYKSDIVDELRAQKFDVALLLQNAFEAAWLAWRAGIPERIGYARDGRSLLLTKAVPVPKPGEIPLHEKYYYLELLAEPILHQSRCA
jgi:heptosyltransferase II